ncbi:SDR family NAD(P)-dependent oxidoreductase [Bradymonadaceae bacterium TMQ3]|uniref:SDR family NAD(P)-dependent oxidoreductase n=1 Tax=Lujinxingia sediminis TaxID=2480984 RepID=A0ABY0CXV9_9DELT|nr:SDR family NAD(P)-dependent oxidoreductase [Lujinxingia sediminis]RDV39411.1 SDR family NAD(P)-dependent oxidoreductase [Bradymonadaceae bacterium TMQ3]RVU48549.1 SDR family NAD(P)-dependent oxidoreductase [Lujinxingia sediminis]TXC77843.1 SDR family NAD(P)-dependent oxidoreductase [Bradymonadales bacterium TMQ1]
MEMRGKGVVVTGAASGIGHALVEALLAKGARVAAVDLQDQGLERLAAEVNAGERLSTHRLDITDRSAVRALPAEVIARHGAVDVVINNAGIIQPFECVHDLSDEVIEHTMDVNFYGTLWMVRAFLPHLLERPEAYLVNVASMGAFLPVPGQAIYGASKAAVKLMTEGLYAELMETSVKVSVVMPGAVATNIAENSGVVMGDGEEGGDAGEGYRALEADKAAEIILEGMEDERLHILVGSDARLMQLANRIAPKGSIRLIQRKMRDLLGDS